MGRGSECGAMRVAIATIVGLSASFASAAYAAEPRLSLEITSREVAFNGASFGNAGLYERVVGVARMSIDPKAEENATIVDLEHAPRDSGGLVHYDVDVVILRPIDPSRASRTLIYDVTNRGGKLALMLNDIELERFLDSPAGFDLSGEDQAGTGFLMHRGYTLVWSGWQGDVAGAGLVGARFPVASDHGKPITGRVTTEIVFDDGRNLIALPYPAASLARKDVVVDVRQRADDEPKILPSDAWHYKDSRHIAIRPPAHMDKGAIYRVSYIARDPRVMGLGFPAVRDLVDFLRHDTTASDNPLADLGAGHFDVVVGYGASQSGRYLRDFVWQGFNRSVGGNRVFDGVIAMVPGARRTFTNARFSEPGRFGRQHEDHGIPGFDFPFTYASIDDPESGRRDGIMASCEKTETCPKLFHIDTSAEFWQAGASLVGTGGTDRDVPFPANVRAYMIAGGSHTPGVTAPICEGAANTLDYRPPLRSLLVSMEDWVREDKTPPDSQWPSLARNELVEADALKPPVMGKAVVGWAQVVNKPRTGTSRANADWPVLVPAIDKDGNDRSGVKLPDIAVPDGTYLGWSLRKPGYAPGELCFIYGSFIPFEAQLTDRRGDERLSLSQRYRLNTRASLLHESAEKLFEQGFLMREDADRFENLPRQEVR